MWGSDYPHAEGITVSDAVRADLPGLNAARLFKPDPVVATSATIQILATAPAPNPPGPFAQHPAKAPQPCGGAGRTAGPNQHQ